MDIILLPGDDDNTAGAGELFDGGLEQLGSLYHWLHEQSATAPALYLVLPARAGGHSEMIASLARLHRCPGGQIFFIVCAGSLHAGLLAELEANEFHHIIITGHEGKDIQPAVNVLARYRDDNGRSNLHVSFWLSHEPGFVNYRLHSLLQRAGIATESIGTPLFGPAKETENILLPEIADVLQQTQPVCQIVNETLVINEKGEILFCPAFRPDKPLASLFDHSPEQLLLQKGRCSGDAGRMGMCIACDYRGRFQWKENKSEKIGALLQSGRLLKDGAFRTIYNPWDSLQCDMSLLTEEELAAALADFEQRLGRWMQQAGRVPASGTDKPLVAVETPVFKGAWLIPCIESVLYQTAHQWAYYLVWDGGDELSRRILEIVNKAGHPRLHVFFSANKGIARARHFLSSRSVEEYILPLDDDDMLGAAAVADFLEAAALRPWSSLIRARRRFIDEQGKLVDMDEWFPFENRRYRHGMVTDLHNHCQPALMRRSAYVQTEGWEGFPDFFHAGEDCDIYLKLEEKGSVELVDKLLYFYRLNPQRTSHELKPEGAYEMWRRLADRTIARIGLPVKRLNERPPFEYARSPMPALTQDMIDFVIPFYDADEEELPYDQGRPSSTSKPEYFELTGYNHFRQDLAENLLPATRIELLFSAEHNAEGMLRLEITGSVTGTIIAAGETPWTGRQEVARSVSFILRATGLQANEPYFIRLRFLPSRKNYATIRVLYYEPEEAKLIARFFKHQPGYSKRVLERCLLSLRTAGISEDTIHIVNQKRSSAANRNSGFRMTRKPLVCFLDDDTEIISGDTFRELLKTMTETGADIIGPRLVTPSGKIFCADPFFNEGLRPVPKGIGEDDNGNYRYTSVVPWLPSTLFIIKREVLVAVNGFDEGYAGSQMEDVDFCLKARQRDFRCVYAGHVSVVHYNNQRNDRFAENFGRFQLRWKQHDYLFTPVNTTEA